MYIIINNFICWYNIVYSILIFVTYLILSKGFGFVNMAIVISTVSSDDLDTIEVSSTCTTQLDPGGKGAPVLTRAHSPSFISFWKLGY